MANPSLAIQLLVTEYFGLHVLVSAIGRANVNALVVKGAAVFHGQRTAEEVAAEWQFVGYLAANGVSVAPVVKIKGGDSVMTFTAPEGTRYGVLSTYAEGEHLRRRPSAEAVYTYGRIIAQIHTLADQMSFSLKRPENNIKTIIAQSIAAFEAEVLDSSG